MNILNQHCPREVIYSLSRSPNKGSYHVDTPLTKTAHSQFTNEGNICTPDSSHRIVHSETQTKKVEEYVQEESLLYQIEKSYKPASDCLVIRKTSKTGPSETTKLSFDALAPPMTPMERQTINVELAVDDIMTARMNKEKAQFEM